MKHVQSDDLIFAIKEDEENDESNEGMTKQTNAPLGKITIFSELTGAKDCQSMVSWTGQVEESIHKAYCSFIEKAEHFIYIEMAAALAASSIAFRQSDPLYANKFVSTATRGFGYADNYSGAYLQAGLKVLPSTTRGLWGKSKHLRLEFKEFGQWIEADNSRSST
ncbi:phospholipase D zeta 1-like protein isoform X1 [Tanacetum coccineum]